MKIEKFIKYFLGPMFLGIFIAVLDKILIHNINDYNYAIFSTVFYTISVNITNFLKWFAPIMTFFLIARSISHIKTHINDFLKRFFLVLFISLIILSIITFGIGLIFVPLFPQNAINIPINNTSINSIFTIDLEPVINIFNSILLGFLFGIFTDENSYVYNFIYEGEKIIYMILKKIIYPMMPLWIIGSIAQFSYTSGAIQVISYDLYLSMLILFIQFFWLFIMYFISSKYLNISLKIIIKSAAKIYAVVVSMAGNTAGVIVPIIVNEQKKIGMDQDIAKFISSSSFNLPGSLISNIIFMLGIVYMFDLKISLFMYIYYIVALIITLIASPAISGGVWVLTQSLLTPILGFNSNMIQIMGSLYFKQGTSNAAVNNCGDFYMTALISGKKGKNTIIN